MESLEARLSSASLSADVAGGARGWGNLYVSNLPPHVQDHDVHQLFAPYGSVLDMQVMRRPDGSAKGNVFISFRHPHEGQAAAAALNGIIIGGSPTPLSVRPSNRKSITSSRRSSTGSERRGASPVSMHAGPFGHVRGADAKQSGFAYPGGPVAPSG
jgi:RNA recognition motif-containing protein